MKCNICWCNSNSWKGLGCSLHANSRKLMPCGFHEELIYIFVAKKKALEMRRRNEAERPDARSKDCAATLLSEHGPLHEAQMLGHTPAVAMKHYADVHNLELRKGL